MKLSVKIIIALILVTFAIGAFAQSNNPHAAAHRKFLASQEKNKNQNIGNLTKSSQYVDLNLDEIEPEIDIYMEGMNSRSVNPFKEKDVPNSKVINVTGYAMPVMGKVTSGYGYRPKFGRMHKGVDLSLKLNEPVVAAFEGKVRVVNYEAKGYGNYVIIRHPNGLETVYGHLNKHMVKEGQYVKAGETIGLGGSTGRSTGPHLHFETRFMGYAINPAAIFDFANHTTHTDEYTFSKQTYQQARDFSPKKK